MNGNLITLTRDEFYKIGEKLHGEDRKKWVFCCEWCDNEQSFESIMQKIEKDGFIKSMRYGIITKENISKLQPRPDQECLSEKCNYASYGLFGSSLEIENHRYLALKGMTETIEGCDKS